MEGYGYNVDLPKDLSKAFENVWNVSTKHKISMRIAAYVFALEKVAKAIRSRGSY